MVFHRLVAGQFDYAYVGYDVIFKTKDKWYIRKILGITETSVKVDFPDLNNSLSRTRRLYVIMEWGLD